MVYGARTQSDVQRSTTGATAIFAAPSAGRLCIKSLAITGNVSTTGTVKIHSTTHVLAEYIPTNSHPGMIELPDEGFRLEEGEALTLTTGVANFLVNVVAIASQLG